jgi:hypothetical protein
MSDFRFVSNPPLKCQEKIRLKNGYLAPRASAAILSVAISGLLTSNPNALMDLIEACTDEQHCIAGNTAKLLQGKDLIQISGSRVTVPDIVKHLVACMLPPPGSGARLQSPFADQ